MNTLARQCTVGLLAGAVLVSGAMADRSEGAMRFESGGATLEEFQQLNQRANDYSLKLVLAAKGSGAYLADVDVEIVALPQRERVLQTRTEGPLLLADLPPGRYEVTGNFDGVLPGAASSVRRTVVVPRHGTAQAVMYFDTGDQVGSESPPQYETRS